MVTVRARSAVCVPIHVVAAAVSSASRQHGLERSALREPAMYASARKLSSVASRTAAFEAPKRKPLVNPNIGPRSAILLTEKTTFSVRAAPSRAQSLLTSAPWFGLGAFGTFSTVHDGLKLHEFCLVIWKKGLPRGKQALRRQPGLQRARRVLA